MSGKASKPENIGKEREHALGYYGTFKQALRGMSEKMIGSSDASKVEELVGLLDGIEEAIINIPDELGETVHSFVTYRDSWRSIVEHVLRSLSEDNKEEAMAKLHRLKEGLGRIPEVWEEEMKEEADDGGGDA